MEIRTRSHSRYHKQDKDIAKSSENLENLLELGYDLAHASNEAHAVISNGSASEEVKQEAMRRFELASSAASLIFKYTKPEMERYGQKKTSASADAKLQKPLSISEFVTNQSERLFSSQEASKITDEQWQRSYNVYAMMSEHLGLDPNDINVVLSNATSESRPIMSVAYTAPSGIFQGNWKKIMDDKLSDQYRLKLSDGTEADVRKGMTRSVYEAMVEDARTRGDKILPDSARAGTKTWITGEVGSETPEGAPVGSLSFKGETRFSRIDTAIMGRAAHFRPAVTIGPVKQ